MKKKLLKQVSLVLIIALLIGVLPQGAIIFADDETQTQQPTELNHSNPEPKIIGELVEKREKDKKYFLMDDKSISAAIYPEAVHYQKEGKWEDIDNSLSESEDAEGAKVLENKANSFKVKFAKETNKQKLVKYSKDGYTISWALDDALKSEAVNKALTDNTKGLSDKEKTITLKNRSSIVDYKDILSNIDLQYITKGDNVKENIILKSKEAQNAITFTYNLGKLEAKLNKDKTITIFDPSKPENTVFAFEAPYMYDADQDRCDNVNVTLIKDGDNYKLTLIADKEWLNAKDTKYPVTIDPTITSKIATNDIWETYIRSGQPNTSKAAQAWITAGHSQYGTDRIVIKFANLVPLTTADKIVSAKMYFQASNACMNWDYTASNPRNIIEAHEILYDWENLYHNSSVTWNNMYSLSGGNEYFSGEVIDYAVVGKCFSDLGYYNTYSWDLTKLAKKWYETGINYGVTLKYGNETVNEWPDFWSSDGTIEAVFPVIYFNYRNTSGLEDYWTYHSQSNGRAGAGYVNDYTGNVVWIHNDTDTTGNKMPISINHVYNASKYNENNGLGYGWQLSNNEILGCTYTYERALYDSGYQYYLVDSDGTKHFFIHNGSGKHTDEDGLGLSLQYDTNRWVMTDKNGNKKEFSDNGLLIKVIDTNGNSYTQFYTSINGNNRLTTITDGAGRNTTLNYNSNGRLDSIVDPAGRTTNFYYDNWCGGYLERIRYSDNTDTLIGYGGPNCMMSCIRNIDQKAIIYEYISNSPYRAKKYYVADWSNTGTYVDITYNHNETIFKENNDNSRVFTYQFDNWGHTTCVKDAQGNAQYYAQGTSGGATNKTTMTSKMQKTTTNLLKNHNFELSGEWYESTDGLQSGSRSIVTEEHYNIGTKSSKFINNDTDGGISGYHQYITGKANTTYILSAYVKMTSYQDVGFGGGATFLINSPSACVTGGTLKSTTDGWERVSMTYTTGSDMSYFYIIVGLINCKGTAYFDCVQLEEVGTLKIETPSRYNILENGGLESWSGTTPMYWNTWLTNSNDTTCSTVRPYSAGTSSYKITGESDKNKNIYREYVYSGSAGDNFVFGSWAKADSVPTQYGRSEFKVLLCLNYDDGTQGWFGVDFNYGTNQWQFASSNAVAIKSYNRITMWLCYYQNANTVYFDDAFLYKEEFGQSYQYDSKGNIVSTADLAKQQTTFANDNNNLTKLTTPEGSNFNYVYDSKKNITLAKSSDGTKYSFTYDDYGNPLTSKIESSQEHPDIVVGQVYRIKSKSSGLYLDAFGPAPGYPNGNDVGQWSYHNGENQKWMVINGSGGYLKLMNMYNVTGPNYNNGKVIDIDSGINANDVKIQMWDNGVGNSNQDLTFVKSEDGSYSIKTRCSSQTKTITVQNNSTETSAKVIQFEVNGCANQQWYFEPLGNVPVKVDTATTNAAYYIKNVDSGLYLSVTDMVNENANALQTTFILDTKQIWATSGSNGTYSLRNLAANKYLYASQNTNGAATRINSTNTQNWTFIKNVDGTFRIANASYSGKILGSSGSNPNSAVNIYDYNPSSINNTQKWILEITETPTTSINSSAEYYPNSSDNRLKGNYVSKVTDARGNDVNYDYNPLKGTLNSVSDAKDKTTSYTYDANTDVLNSVSKNVTPYGSLQSQTITNSYDYENDKLHYITHNSFNYHFGYDWAGNNTTVDVGTQNLITNQYNIPKGLLTRSTYGNGHYIDFGYDEQDRVIEKKYNNNSATSFKYVYNNNGNLGILKDFVNNNTITYTYDLIDRLTKISQTNGLSLFYSYDSKNRINEQTFKLNAITNKTGYIYGDQKALNNSRGYRDEKAGLIYGITVNGTQRVAYEYDYLNRLSSRTLNTTNPFTTKYDFIAGSGTNTTTTLLAGITNGSNAAITYTYDDNGNIETISEAGVEKVRYYYDELNQLVREDNKYLADSNYLNGKIILYTYDVGGNIISKAEYAYTTETLGAVQKTYTYGYDVNWKDKLTSYSLIDSVNSANNFTKAITYPSSGDIGNTLTFDGWTFSWQNGRQLAGMSKTGTTTSYKYNDSGIRTQKTVNGVTTNYYLDGDKVIFETKGTDTIYYTYDENGDLIGFNLKNSTYPSGADFYYIRNGQNDITGILDSIGTQVVFYSYDSWGKLLSIKDQYGNDKTNDQSFEGYINPYRYRGYRYDTETGLYLLQSRYYNPEVSRFLNADDTDVLTLTPYELTDKNLFSYCDNNPIIRKDPNGKFFVFAVEVAVISDAAVAPEPTMTQTIGQFLNTPVQLPTLPTSVSLPLATPLNPYLNFARDSGKNEPHGDNGRALQKVQKQIDDLRKQQQNSGSKKEKQRIQKKIDNILRAARRSSKGENHSQSGKR